MLHVLLTTTLLPLISAQSQAPLSPNPNYQPLDLSNSIFRPSPHTLSSLTEPETLPPTYYHSLLSNLNGELYQGINTFAHLDYVECMSPESNKGFDIGIVGHPFDLGVSYRPGARFGPNGARQGARRMGKGAGWDTDHPLNPFQSWATVVDCGDISNDPFDKLTAIHELEKGMTAMNNQTAKNISVADNVRLISIGGDHTITLPILRALYKTYGPVSILHFDSHLDTWSPTQLGGGKTKYSSINHGTMLHIAHQEGLISNTTNLHLGTRCSLFDESFDLENDRRCGFDIVKAREIDSLGVEGVVESIVERLGYGKGEEEEEGGLVYVSIDIDVLDPAFAPATGTIEPGGWSTRELLQILRLLSKKGIKIVGADVVEFTPVYDNTAETTGIAVAQIVYEVLQWMVNVPVKVVR